MTDLIEALQIFLKYGNDSYPTFCEHDILGIRCVDPKDVSPEDIERLDQLGFFISEEYGEETFVSFKFGS